MMLYTLKISYLILLLERHDRVVVMLVAMLGGEPHLTPFAGSQQQRPMEHHSKAVLVIARRLVQTVFYAVQEEDEKRIEC
ncbi:hypothetical protein KIN20_033473 [Parelaphostrongylus tenuis]|uniref:Uncharacterized protein n=1 Tax=Parelaphostrongylus tenuis TaxID=148309 RepID=A0AAD5R8N9_PARTN|nr:hypothetical protein KIN20_033473 [Parelaphostrongylus tenuis]